MSDCCAILPKEDVVKQRNVLVTVLLLNGFMFFAEAFAGIWSGSSAVLADSLDMLSDALVYGLSLWSLHKTDLWKGRISTVKGVLMTVLASVVLIGTVAKAFLPIETDGSIMFGAGLLALAVNGICFTLLNRHKEDGINLRSAWVCSRNDLLANVGVLVGGILVLATSSKWPDIILGFIIGCYVLKSSISVIRESREALKKHNHHVCDTCTS